MEAAFYGRDEILRLMIEHNAHLNVQSGKGWTALHYAGQAGQLKCVGLLIAAGADKELKNKKGKTAYNRAIEQKKMAVAEMIAH
jgi:ankyrin repeat protein